MLKDIRIEPFGIQLYESKHHAGDRIEEHHHQVYQLLYALEGTGKIILDGKEYLLEQDHLTFITPLTPHAIISDHKLTVLVLAFDRRIKDGTNTELFEKSLYGSKFIGLNPFNSSEIRQLLRTMLYEQAHDSLHQETALRTYLSQLLLLIARGGKNNEKVDANTLRAERLKDYIDSHYFDWIHAEDLASRLGISTRHMNTIFKETYYMTPVQYLTEVRVGLAKKMLAETDKDIASICFEVGFESLSTFYRAFKNITEISPNKYRTKQQHIDKRS
ncbi:helix-turn-helix transcriptional regulator [Gracilibacillus thailandensis]|jgi:AraC-like DNA-binding protein/quercetin dioxygenase-like cupin family protein|uniref:Helix-turn-helix domain-containing protein n=1 Tax=Gracilibacillus thailandensis TaxID=563735 RepID=A0A6N7R032_9BACI|nr:AraC family transcriptional regulator [Gracilibacillus thailandensis]MRI65519.1 helix-turn-helix domain-containing protein [Gracilibacillus thailandensis]